MKKLVCLLMIILILPGVFAEEMRSSFEVTEQGDEWTISLKSNSTTGYQWSYELSDPSHVSVLEEKNVNDSELLGANGTYELTIKVLKEGVSTIEMSYGRAFEKVPAETLSIVIYKNGDKVFIEENQVVTINEEETLLEVEKTDDYFGVPVAKTLRSLGYDVQWHGDTRTVHISKDDWSTVLSIDENSYTSNEISLSHPPTIVQGVTLVPIEFFYEVMSLGYTIEEDRVLVGQEGTTVYEGYLKGMDVQDDVTRFEIGYASSESDVDVVVYVYQDTAWVQKDFKIGDKIHVITSMMSTKSLPPQTTGYIVY